LQSVDSPKIFGNVLHFQIVHGLHRADFDNWSNSMAAFPKNSLSNNVKDPLREMSPSIVFYPFT